jgi:hypothetical protein
MNTRFSRTQHALSEHPKRDTSFYSKAFFFLLPTPSHSSDFSGSQVTTDAACCPCGLLISGMASLAAWQSASVMIAMVRV